MTTPRVREILPATCRECGERPAYITTLCEVCWDASCRRYSERMAELDPERTRHALCDHAYGICCER